MEDRILEIIEKVCGEDANPDDLMEVLDSMMVMELMTEIEETFDIEIDADDILPENFDSAEHIQALVEKTINE